jgi:hypothetical protein
MAEAMARFVLTSPVCGSSANGSAILSLSGVTTQTVGWLQRPFGSGDGAIRLVPARVRPILASTNRQGAAIGRVAAETW